MRALASGLLAVFVLAGALMGCPSEKRPSDTGSPNDTSLAEPTRTTTVAAVPTASTAAGSQAAGEADPTLAEASDIASAPPEATAEASDVAAAATKDTVGRPARAADAACRRKAAWVGLSRCTDGTALYAVGAVEGVGDPSLLRSAAADRARRALDPSAARIEWGEVIDFVRCGDAGHALARGPLGKGERVPACRATALASRARPPKGCPAFTTNIARREGELIVVVGVARIKNPALAEAAATNRARAEASRLVAVTLASGPHGASTRTEETGYTELHRQKAICGTDTYVELTVRPLDR